MKSLLKYFLPNNEPVCLKHKNSISRICCNQKCIQKQNYLLCDHYECLQTHRKHTTVTYQNYQELILYIQREIKFKKQVKSSLASYKRQLINNINIIWDRVEKNIDQFLNERCSSKYLTEIEKKFQYQEHFQHDKKLDFYKTFLPSFPKIQIVKTRQFISQEFQKNIKFSEKKCIKNMNLEFLGLDNSIFPNADIKEIREYSKQEKLKKILPFKCQLISKFKASQHNFLSRKLYATDIRGPIILIAQSHKNRIFGGFSPVMFPKNQEYIQDSRQQCFLFSLDDKCLLPIKEEFTQYSIRGGKNFWFGRGDLAISDECHKGNISWAQIGRAYKAPSLAYGNQSSWLAGAWYFRVIEYEIFQVEIQSIK